MRHLSEAVLGNMKGRRQIFVLKDNVSQPTFTLRRECRVAQWQNTQGRDVLGQCILVRHLATLLSSPCTRLRWGSSMLRLSLMRAYTSSSAVRLDLRSFEVSKAARVRDPSLKSNPHANSREFLMKNLWLRRCIRLCSFRHKRRPKVPYNEARLFDEIRKPRAVFFMRAVARG